MIEECIWALYLEVTCGSHKKVRLEVGAIVPKMSDLAMELLGVLLNT